MADEIPETLDLNEAKAVMSDKEHPLHNAYRAGNPALQERIEAAYRQHYGSSEAEPAPPREEMDSREREYREMYPGTTDAPELDPAVAELFDAVAQIETSRGEDYEANNQIIADRGMKFFNNNPEECSRFLQSKGLLKDPELLAEARRFLVRWIKRNT